MNTFSVFRKILHLFVALAFLCSGVVPVGAQGIATVSGLPLPGSIVGLSSGYQSPVLVGLKIHPENPLMFDFIVDPGSSDMNEADLAQETEKLVKYFLAALTIPDQEVWVNLSPYEKDRIVPDALGQTVMGKTMLEQDYILKQLAASLTDPKEKLGQEFWGKVKTQVKLKLGDTEVPMNTFNKVWIVPSKAEVLENKDVVVIGERRLKVMMEQDYVALSNQKDSVESPAPAGDGVSKISSEVFKNTILPDIEKEVNEGKNFTEVRQIYNSVILATWYKQALKESFLGKVYADKSKVAGIETEDKEMKQKIYAQYVAAFKKGVYNLIQEEEDSATGDLIPRKYFSGGLKMQFGFDDSAPLVRRQASSGLMSNELERIKQMEQGIWKQAAGLIQVIVTFDQFESSTRGDVINSSRLPELSYQGFVAPADAPQVVQSQEETFVDTVVPEPSEVSIGNNIQAAAQAIAKAGPEAQKRFEYHFTRFVAINKAFLKPESDRYYKNILLMRQFISFVTDPLLQSPNLKEFEKKFRADYEAARVKPNGGGYKEMERIGLIMRLMSSQIKRDVEQQGQSLESSPAQDTPIQAAGEATSGLVDEAVKEVQADTILIDLLKANGQPIKLEVIPDAVRKMVQSILNYAQGEYSQQAGWTRTTPLPTKPGVGVIRLEDDSFSDEMTKYFTPVNEAALRSLGFGISELQFFNEQTYRPYIKPALTLSSDVRKIIDAAARASAALTVNEPTATTAQNQNVGGIDFNASNLDLEIKRDGNGIMLPISQQNWEQINIEGLAPVILNVSPIDMKNLPIYLGQNSSEPQAQQAQALKNAS